MKSNTLLLLTAFIALVVAVLHSQAIVHYWYWTYWWMDIITHVLGGVVVAFGGLWFLVRFFGKKYALPSYGLLWTLLVFTVAVGVGWEVFEFLFDLHLAKNPLPDTIQDIFADTAGGLLAYVVYDRFIR